MAILGFELEEIVQVIRIVEEHRLDEIVFKQGDRYLRVRGLRPVTSAPCRAPPGSATFRKTHVSAHRALTAGITCGT